MTAESRWETKKRGGGLDEAWPGGVGAEWHASCLCRVSRIQTGTDSVMPKKLEHCDMKCRWSLLSLWKIPSLSRAH